MKNPRTGRRTENVLNGNGTKIEIQALECNPIDAVPDSRQACERMNEQAA